MMNLINVSPIPAWELSQFLTNIKNYSKSVMPILAGIVGVICLVWGFITIGKGLLGSQQGQTPWGRGAALIIFGGIMTGAGWGTYFNIGNGMHQTVDKLGGGGADSNSDNTIVAKPTNVAKSTNLKLKSVIIDFSQGLR